MSRVARDIGLRVPPPSVLTEVSETIPDDSLELPEIPEVSEDFDFDLDEDGDDLEEYEEDFEEEED